MESTITLATHIPPYPHPPHPYPTHRPPTIPSPQPVPWFQNIGKSGIDSLWVGFVVFLVSTLVIAVLASRQHKKHRVFHHLTLTITAIAALSYYAMATRSGATYVNVGWHSVQGVKAPVLRQVFWVRYVEWALTSPLILLGLAFLAGLPWLDILTLIVADEAMVLTGLFAAFHPGHVAAKWGWYAFSCIFLIYILFSLIWSGRKCARLQHSSVSGLYTQLAIYTLVIWLIYPIIWGLGSGSGRINVNIETIAYTVLDILAKVVFGFWLLIIHKHDSDEACAVRFSDHWTEPRGGRSGAIQLPGGE